MRKHEIVTIFICVLLFAGCRQKNQDQYLTEVLEVNGIERTYHIHLPPNFDQNQPAPLVLALHGGGGEGLRFDESTNGTLVSAADARGVVLVFPEGLNNQWCDGRTEILDAGSECTVAGDVAFISALIDVMEGEYGIDTKRVYVTGISNGGFMSIRLALDLPEKITAVAPVAAQLPSALQDQSPSLPISIMIVNGTEDPIVPFDGGDVRLVSFGRSRGEVLSTTATVTQFRLHNGCDSTPEQAQLPDNDANDGTTVEIESYSDCEDGVEVILVRVVGGGHTWPGGKQYLSQELVGTVSQEINASEMILDFFLNHIRE